jgi:hypothetical protein
MAVADASRGPGTSLVGLGGRRLGGRRVDDVRGDLHARQRIVDLLLVAHLRSRRFLDDLVLGLLGLLALTLLRSLGLLGLTTRDGIRFLALTLRGGLGLPPLEARGSLGLLAILATGLGRLFVRGLDLDRRAGRSIAEAGARCYRRLVEGRAIRLGSGLGVGLGDDIAGRLNVTCVERRVFW